MNIQAIRRFNDIPDDQVVYCPSGTFVNYNGNIYEYPEYTGEKQGWYDYYYTIGKIKGWGDSLFNNILHQAICDIGIL